MSKKEKERKKKKSKKHEKKKSKDKVSKTSSNGKHSRSKKKSRSSTKKHDRARSHSRPLTKRNRSRSRSPERTVKSRSSSSDNSGQDDSKKFDIRRQMQTRRRILLSAPWRKKVDSLVKASVTGSFRGRGGVRGGMNRGRGRGIGRFNPRGRFSKEDYMDESGNIDKRKLLEIATKNATKLAMEGKLPKGAELIDTIKNKSVEQLVSLCKHLKEERDALERVSSSDDEEKYNRRYEDWRRSKIKQEECDGDDFVSRPVRPANEIKINIATVKKNEEKLRLEFPVSSGIQHRSKLSTMTVLNDINQQVVAYGEIGPLTTALSRVKTNIPSAYKPFDNLHPFAVNLSSNFEPGALKPPPTPPKLTSNTASTQLVPPPMPPTNLKPFMQSNAYNIAVAAVKKASTSNISSNPAPFESGSSSSILLPPPPTPPVLSSWDTPGRIVIESRQSILKQFSEKKSLNDTTSILHPKPAILSTNVKAELSTAFMPPPVPPGLNDDLNKSSDKVYTISTNKSDSVDTSNMKERQEFSHNLISNESNPNTINNSSISSNPNSSSNLNESFTKAKSQSHFNSESSLSNGQSMSLSHELDTAQTSTSTSLITSSLATAIDIGPKLPSHLIKTQESSTSESSDFITRLDALVTNQVARAKATSELQATIVSAQLCLPPPPKKKLLSSSSVFDEAVGLTEPLKPITELVADRLKYNNRLKENPNDYHARKRLSEIEEQIAIWAQGSSEPGLFTGSTGAKILSEDDLQPSHPKYHAWVKKDQLKTAPEISSGVGMRLLQKMGWQPGQGLGRDKAGPLEPLCLDIKSDRKGLMSLTDKKISGREGCFDSNGKNPISVLMEHCNHTRCPVPEFFCDEMGPPNDRRFRWKAIFNGVEYEPSLPSTNKKAGKAQVCMVVLQALGLTT